MNALKSLLVAACSTVLLAPAASYGAEKNAAGFLSYASHDELVKAAKAETGTLQLTIALTQPGIDELVKLFTATYGIKAVGQDVGQSDSRILLEIKAGTNKSDILHMEEELGLDNYYPHLYKMDLLGMAEKKVIDLPVKMVNPKQPNAAALGSALAGVSYNSKLLPPGFVIKSYEDLLDPRLKNGQIWVDVSQASGLAALFVVWGKDKVIDYTTKLADQKPIWTTGATRSITSMAAGEYAAGSLNHYHSVIRVRDQRKAPHINAVLLEPVPVRLNNIWGINEKSTMPASAALFIEFAASDKVQEIFDREGPIKGSVFKTGSLPNKLVEGKKIAFVGWDDVDEIEPMQKRIFESWKFPTAKK
ncbi:MAG: iron(III) transport system substrate-binding protein [Alphaproteobacteria bacterium]|jgi:ABC-type Fe3+ transport system substrate-binding protein|nr:iron(III) transport system substrate-binding protein [Alphaproteobacteria bacterium]